MSDTSQATGKDTRPFNFDDPSLSDVDEAAISAIGQDVQNQLEADVASQFINRGGQPETGVGTSTDASTDAPGTGSAPAPDTTGAGDATGQPTTGQATQPATQQSTEPVVFNVPIPGIDPATGAPYAPIALTPDQTLELLREHQYYATRPKETLEAWGAIEAGTHRPVPLQDWAAFQQWQNSGRPATKDRGFDVDELTPEARAYIEKLEGTQTAVTNTPVQTTIDQAPVTPAQLIQQQQAAVDRQVALQLALDATRTKITQQYGLDQGQLHQLEIAVRDAQVIPSINAKYRVMNPLGTAVMAEGDPNVVLGEAFETVMSTHPQFKPIRDETIFQARLAQSNQVNQTAAGKKAAAGSLAHVPSAAVSSQGNTQKTIEQMTPQERQAAMTAEIAQLIASGEAVN